MNLTLSSIPVYIASGGASRRFGSEKARAKLPDGRTLLEHVAARLKPIASSITVVADRASKYADLGLRTIGDQQPGCGPLAGLQAALHDAADQTWILYTSCDFLGFELHWIEYLWNERLPGRRAIAFRSQETVGLEFSRWEPVFALYHTELLAAVNTALRENRLTFWRFLEEHSAHAIPAPEDWNQAISINTPADLQRYLRSVDV